MIFMAALVFAAISCTKTEFSQPAENLVDFTLSGAKASSKTVLNGASGEVLWLAGDEISVFDNHSACAGHRFASESCDKQMLAEFKGQIDADAHTLYALYPYNAAASISGTKLTTTLPVEQTATVGSFANGAGLSFATCTLNGFEVTSGDVIFEPLTSVIAFTMPSYIDGAQSVVVRANNGAPIAGTVVVDALEGKIVSVSGSNSITLSVNTLSASSSYYVAIAPGTYEGGFSFRVKTASGNEYTASTTKTLPAAAGEIYPLGTLGLVLSVTPTVAITHTQNASGELNGSQATLNIPTLPDEFASLVTGWSVELKRGETIYRRLSSTSGVMSVANGWDYLPQGNYEIVAKYTLVNGTVKSVKGSAVSPSPASKISASVGGYCSYDYYVGSNGCAKNVGTANGLNNATIYAPSVKVNVDASLLSDTKYGAKWSYSWDGGTAVTFSGNSVSFGNLGGQSWAAHSLTVNCTFDGASVSASRTFHITGLPFVDNDPTNADWSLSGNASVSGGNSLKLGGGTGKAEATKSFYCPANIGVSVSTNFSIKKVGLISSNCKFYISGSQVIEKSIKWSSTGTFDYSESASGTLTTSNPSVMYKFSYEAAGSEFATIKSCSLTYR